jgi:hypothetical protein
MPNLTDFKFIVRKKLGFNKKCRDTEGYHGIFYFNFKNDKIEYLKFS